MTRLLLLGFASLAGLGLWLARRHREPARKWYGDPPLADWMLSDIADRDGQTAPVAVASQLPLGRSGTKYDHARRQTSDYHLDTCSLARGDRHLLLSEVRRLRYAAQHRSRWREPEPFDEPGGGWQW